MKLTIKELEGMARKGAGNVDVETQLGRKMTERELVAVRKGRASVRMERAKRTARVETPDAGSWRAELDRLKCALAELDLQTKDGTLLRREDVMRMAQEDAAAIKTAMLGMPNALAPQLVGLTKPEEVRAILSDWARSTLQGWHDSLQGAQGEGMT